MPWYRFTCRYQAGDIGPYAVGDLAELTDEQAEWLLRDVTGCIEPVELEAKAVLAESVEAPEENESEREPDSEDADPDEGDPDVDPTRSVDAAPNDRQLKTARKRSVAGVPDDLNVMTPENTPGVVKQPGDDEAAKQAGE